MMTLSLMCFATAFTWQTFLLCLWCELDTLCRFLSYAVSWAVVISVMFPQHVYQQGQFAFTLHRSALPVAEPESTIGGISMALALSFLCLWELYFTLLRMRQSSASVLLVRTVGVGGALVATVVYFASYFEDEEMIFTFGTELYCLCLCWILLILTFATTVYETHDMRIKLCIASHTTMTAASTIMPFGLSAMERAGVGSEAVDTESNFTSVQCGTIPQSRPSGSNTRQRRVHKHSHNAGTTTKLCENCEVDTQATLFCEACGVHYCEACASAVHAPRALQLHQLTPIGSEMIEQMQPARTISVVTAKGDDEAAGESSESTPLTPEKEEKVN